MAPLSDTLQPTDRATVQRVCSIRRAHLDHALAMRLYGRMRSRTVLLLRPVPPGIKELIAQWLHRDGLVLACATYTSGNGRRLRCQAQAFTPEQWWRSGQSSWASTPVPFMRIVSTTVLWPGPTGPRQMWPDLPT